MSFVDLHCHSTASDGTLPPAEVVRIAHQVGLTGLALTDHDTVAGLAEAAAEAQRLKIDFLSGIEISCRYPKPGTMHLLGYGVDPANPVLHEMMETLIIGRDARNAKVIAALQQQGVAITEQEVLDAAHGDVIGRPHIAQVLV